MPLDLATLAVSVDADRATRNVQMFGAETEKAAKQTDVFDISTKRLNSSLSSVSSVGATRNMGAWAALNAEAAGKVGEHSLSIGRLGYRLEAMTSEALRANSAVGLLGASFLKFGLGDIYTTAILIGIYALVKGYDLLTDGAQKARKEADELTKSLVAQYTAAYQATKVGAEAVAYAAEQNLANVKKSSGVGAGSVLMSILTGRPTITAGDATAHANEIGDAQTAVTQAWANVGKIVLDSMKKGEEEATREAKAAAEARLEADKKYWATQTELYKAAREEVEKLNALVRNYLADNPASRIVAAAIKGDLPTQIEMPHVGVNDGLTDAQEREIELRKQLNDETDALLRPFKSLHTAADDLTFGMKQAAVQFALRFTPGNVAGSLTDKLLNKVSGGTSSVGGEVGGGAGLAIGAFFGGAIGGEIGSAIGARIGNTIEGLLGGGAEKRTADRLAADSAHSLALGLDEVTKALGGDQLGGAIDALQVGLISTLQSINTALPGTKNEAARNAARQEAQDQEAKQEAVARKQYAEQQQYANEDLQVRLLRATGQGSQADLLAFKEQQAKELQAAIDANKDATYINNLELVQNNELLAYLNGTLQDAVRNSPTGFYGSAAYAGMFATPGSAGYPVDSGIVAPHIAGGLPTGGSSGGAGRIGLTFHPGAIQVDGKGVVTVVLEKIDQHAAETSGAGSSRSQALDTMPR